MGHENLLGKLAVILHADVAASTELVQRDRQTAHRRIQDSFRRFSEIIENYQGRVLELRGDALLARFERALDAVAATLRFQSEQSTYCAGLEDDLRPEVRIGITLGEITVADNTVTGTGVIQAQRIEQLANPGGLCISAPVYEALSRQQPFEFDNLGEQALKGFEYPVRVYRVSLKAGEPVPAPETAAGRATGPTARRLLPAMLAAVLLLAGGLAYWFHSLQSSEPTVASDDDALPLPEKPSLVVLPFENLSDDREQEYFVDGLTEDLITDLSRISGLFVISRNSSFFYKGTPVDVRKVSRELGVRYVLEGSVRRAGQQIRINTQLIDADTGGHVWAERYDRVIENVFDLQDDITARILSALKVRLTNTEQKLAVARYTDQLDAYDSLLQGLALGGYRSREANLEARSHYQRAVEIDPGFARAYATLANTYRVEYRNGWSASPGETLATAFRLATTAIDLDAALPQANFVIALTHREAGNHKKAIVAAERAIELDPNYADAYVALASVLCYGGRSGEGQKLMQRAFRLNPHYPSLYPFYVGLCHFVGGKYEDAIGAFGRAAEMSPDSQRMHLWLAASHALSGNQDEAEWEASIVQTLNPEFRVESLSESIPFKNPRHLEAFLGALLKAGLPG